MKNLILFFFLILAMGMIHGCNNATRDPTDGLIVTEQVKQKAKQDSVIAKDSLDKIRKRKSGQ